MSRTRKITLSVAGFFVFTTIIGAVGAALDDSPPAEPHPSEGRTMSITAQGLVQDPVDTRFLGSVRVTFFVALAEADGTPVPVPAHDGGGVFSNCPLETVICDQPQVDGLRAYNYFVNSIYMGDRTVNHYWHLSPVEIYDGEYEHLPAMPEGTTAVYTTWAYFDAVGWNSNGYYINFQYGDNNWDCNVMPQYEGPADGRWKYACSAQ